MSNVIFVSDAKGFRINYNPNPEPTITLDGKVYAAGDTIVQFNLYRTTDVVRGIVEKGQLILNSETDKEKIEYMRKYPACGKAYREVKSLPQQTMDNGSIVVGAGTSNTANAQQIVSVTVNKVIQFKDLERKLFKEENGELVLKAKYDETELNQYNELKKELNL